MTEETIGGPAASIASHCAAKSGGLASAASGGTDGPHWPRNSRTRASCAASRRGGGSGIQILSWNAPLVLPRTSSAHALMSSGCMSSTPHEPRPPARSEEHTSELQSRPHLVCRLLLEK